ncbi:MAG: menaquinone reductase molybdopterin-binding-like subunit QrcB [Desulfonauticus sp.]|nr:menaquinone reductase molybdopterin-binding-like subunit QrcB [Desulfonauticus sp.]
MGLDRRGFITFLVGGAVGTLCTPIPWKTLDDVSIWSQNWPWIPKLQYGKRSQVASVCKLCPAGCGLSIHKVGKRPVVAQGNSTHPLSEGGVCPLGSCSVRLLYRPARVKGPLKNNNGKFEPISWDEARRILSEKLSSGKAACISGDENGSASEVLAGFLSLLGSEDFYFMPSDAQVSAYTWSQMGGKGQIGFDLENSDYVLSLGADILSSWGTVVRNQKAFATRKGKYIYAGPVQTGTAAAVDEWVPVYPGQEGVLALGIAYYLLKMGKGATIDGFSEVKNFVLSKYTPAVVEAKTGVKINKIKQLAQELVAAGSPCVIIGSDFGQGSGSFDWTSGILLNLLLGNVNKRGGMVLLPEVKVVESAPSRASLSKNVLGEFLKNVVSGNKKIDVLMVYDANPIYALPQALQVQEAFSKIPFKVGFSTFLDETAVMCDLILPAPHFLERYDDAYTPFGSGKVIYSVAAPVIKPVVNAKSTPDFILEVAKSLKKDLGYKSFEDVLKAKASAVGADFEDLLSGRTKVSNKWVGQNQLRLSVEILANGLVPDTEGTFLAPVARNYLGNTTQALTPTEVVVVRDSELKGRDLYVQVNRTTAKKLGLKQGDKVKLQGAGREFVGRVNITETVMDDTIAVPLGFGHEAWDEYVRGKGDNVFKVLSVVTEKGSGFQVWNKSQVKVVRA